MKTQLEKRRLYAKAEALLLKTIDILDKAYLTHLKATAKKAA